MLKAFKMNSQDFQKQLLNPISKSLFLKEDQNAGRIQIFQGSPQVLGNLIFYGIHEMDKGYGVILTLNNTLCGLYFCEKPGTEEDVRALVYPNFKSFLLQEDPSKTQPFVERILLGQPVPMTLIGSPFEISVWRILSLIPSGTVTSYQEVAHAIDNPKAVRAVATAIGRNPISWLIPCHRVVRSTGHLGGYRFGLDKKKALLQQEGVLSP